MRITHFRRHDGSRASRARLLAGFLFGLGAVVPTFAATAVPAPNASGQQTTTTELTAGQLDQQFKTTVKPFLQEYCYRCHGNGKHKGDVTLDTASTLAAIQADHRTWGLVSDVLGQHMMPPEDKPQPSAEQAHAVTHWIESAMEFCDCSGPRDPGHVTIHRLNRNEYNNTIRDLIGVDFKPAEDFPVDDTGYGFDNIADVLTMSPLLAEKYLDAAEQVLGKAIVTGDVTKPQKVRYACATMNATNGNIGGELQTNGEVYGYHDFLCDGGYELRLSASQDKFGDEAAKMVLRIDDKDVRTFDVTNTRGVPGVYAIHLDLKAGHHRIAAAYTNNAVDNTNPDPAKRGDRNLHVRTIEIDGPFNVTRVELPASHRRIFFVTPGADVTESQAARQIIERFATRAFRRPVTIQESDELLSLFEGERTNGDTFENAVKVPLEAVLDSPHFLYRIEQDPPSQLVSVEAARNAPPHPLTDYELATRLSYFLWSSMPNDELFELASEHRLHEPAELARQVNRMLDDPKATALTSNFVGQWLELRNLDDAFRDGRKFRKFNPVLRAAMKKEVELFFSSLVKENRSVLDLVDADYTYLNEPLAKLYGIDSVKGQEFRRVSLADCGESVRKERGGVLEMAGILTLTGMPTRTSPVRRGKFILDEMLGLAPPPQPPDVPQLSARPRDVNSGSIRQRFERHRADPNCAICHLRMDPIGFALENYDAIGAWRTTDNGFPIDTNGKLPDGTEIHSANDVKRVLLDRKELFLRNLSSKLLTYALGRGVEPYDTCTIRDIARQTAQQDYRIRSMITAVVQSEAFLERRAFVEPRVRKEADPAKETKTAEAGINE